VEEENEFIDEVFFIDWVFPPIYDICLDEEDLLEEVNLFIDTIKIVEENNVHCGLMKVQRVKHLSGILRKLIMLIFLVLKILCQLFLNKILMLEQILNFRN
jgi:hypothetical protein